MNPYPEKADIWRDDDGSTYLFLTQPRLDPDSGDAFIINVLNLNTGEKGYQYFHIDTETGTFFDWWQRIG